jgi:hypothetical protein
VSPARGTTVHVDSAAGERGFVLVGVIIFMLALTILGLSLFSLSNYESRFLGSSVDEAQAFYAASGGMEHALFALAKDPDHMSAVKASLPWENIVYARAEQGADSVGAIQPDTTQWVTVRVRSSVMVNTRTAATCMIESQFKPQLGSFVYRYLMSLTDPDTAITILANPGNVDLGTNPQPAKVWQNSPLEIYTTGIGHVPVSIRHGGVPAADLTDFMPGGTVWSNATDPRVPGNSNDIVLQAGNGQWEFFKTPYNPAVGNAGWTLKDTLDNPNIQVNGKCVWMLDHGVFFKKRVILQRSSQTGTSALVVVALKGTDAADPKAAIWFADGIDKGNSGNSNQNYCPIIFVTDGRVRIETNGPQGVTMPYITVYANSCYLSAPNGNGASKRVDLIHDVNAPEDQPSGILQELADLGLLPGVPPATAARFKFVSGTWKQITSTSGL